MWTQCGWSGMLPILLPACFKILGHAPRPPSKTIPLELCPPLIRWGAVLFPSKFQSPNVSGQSQGRIGFEVSLGFCFCFSSVGQDWPTLGTSLSPLSGAVCPHASQAWLPLPLPLAEWGRKRRHRDSRCSGFLPTKSQEAFLMLSQ